MPPTGDRGAPAAGRGRLLSMAGTLRAGVVFTSSLGTRTSGQPWSFSVNRGSPGLDVGSVAEIAGVASSSDDSMAASIEAADGVVSTTGCGAETTRISGRDRPGFAP